MEREELEQKKFKIKKKKIEKLVEIFYPIGTRFICAHYEDEDEVFEINNIERVKFEVEKSGLISVRYDIPEDRDDDMAYIYKETKLRGDTKPICKFGTIIDQKHHIKEKMQY